MGQADLYYVPTACKYCTYFDRTICNFAVHWRPCAIFETELLGSLKNGATFFTRIFQSNFDTRFKQIVLERFIKYNLCSKTFYKEFSNLDKTFEINVQNARYTSKTLLCVILYVSIRAYSISV